MRSLALGVCIALFVAAPPGARAQDAYLLAIGINDYAAFEDEPGGDLLGAEADALLVRDVLTKRWAIPEENVRLLLSREATKDAIHGAITGWLASAAGPGDIAVVYYAGHGAQALDLDGDEPDGLDETLAPSDVLKLSSERDIRDDELRKWLAEIRADVVVILDSCHSGSATRGSGSMRARMLDRDVPDEEGFEPGPVRQRQDTESMLDGSRTILEIAAAAPNQWAVEGDFPTTDGEPVLGGAFTHHLVRELWRAAPATTYADLFGRVAAHLKAAQLEQDPQIEGPADRPLFAAGTSKALAAMPVSASLAAVPNWVRPAEASLSVDVSALAPELRAALEREVHGTAGVELVGRSVPGQDLVAAPGRRGEAIELVGRDGGLRGSVPAGPGAAHGIARTLRKERDLRRLASLDGPRSAFTVDIALAGRRRGLAPGEPIELEVRSPRGGYLTLLSVDPDGTTRVLHPLPWTDPVPLAPGRPVTLPSAGGYAPGTGTGVGMVLAVVSRDPLVLSGLDRAPARHEEADVFGEVREALDALARREGPAGAWGTGLLAYRVAGSS